MLSLGSGGNAIPAPVDHFLRNADLIFGIGCSFTKTNFGVDMPSGKAIVHATLDPMDINKDVACEQALIGDAKLVLEALLGRQSEFVRTPKHGVERNGDDWIGKKYHQMMLWQPLVEVALGIYFTGTVFYALAQGIYGTLPFLVLFQVGFLYTGGMSLLQQFGGEEAQLSTQTAGE